MAIEHVTTLLTVSMRLSFGGEGLTNSPLYRQQIGYLQTNYWSPPRHLPHDINAPKCLQTSIERHRAAWHCRDRIVHVSHLIIITAFPMYHILVKYFIRNYHEWMYSSYIHRSRMRKFYTYVCTLACLVMLSIDHIMREDEVHVPFEECHWQQYAGGT